MSIVTRIKQTLGTLTVDGIIADIVLKVEQLHAVKELKIAEEKAHAEVIAETQKLKDAAAAEWARALKLADKFKELIS